MGGAPQGGVKDAEGRARQAAGLDVDALPAAQRREGPGLGTGLGSAGAAGLWLPLSLPGGWGCISLCQRHFLLSFSFRKN